jgi:defect-in-organelle-trafficking protein DotB
MGAESREEQELKFPDEPMTHWAQSDLDKLLVWCVEQKSSDICLQPNNAVWIRQHGQWKPVTHREMSSEEIFELVDQVTGTPSSSAQLKGGQDLDFAYEVSTGRFAAERFRVNATACRDGWGTGAAVTMRSIPSIPPRLEELDVEDEILDHAYPDKGLILVTGTVGTGKSTLLASILRNIAETQHRKIVTYEHPIEFDLMGIPDPCGPIVQTGIPEHLNDFSVATRNAMRRAVDVMLVGESRDQETLWGMLEAAETGVAAYSTVHTQSVADTPTRIINVFPTTMQQQVASTLLSSLRLVVQQRLEPSPQGGRVPIKEFLAFDRPVREEIMEVGIKDISNKVQDLVEQRGRPLLRDAQEKYDAGLLYSETMRKIEREKKREE